MTQVRANHPLELQLVDCKGAWLHQTMPQKLDHPCIDDLGSPLIWIQVPSDMPHGTLQQHPASRTRGLSVGKLPMMEVTNQGAVFVRTVDL